MYRHGIFKEFELVELIIKTKHIEAKFKRKNMTSVINSDESNVNSNDSTMENNLNEDYTI